jgi:hypothetical protein
MHRLVLFQPLICILLGVHAEAEREFGNAAEAPTKASGSLVSKP